MAASSSLPPSQRQISLVGANNNNKVVLSGYSLAGEGTVIACSVNNVKLTFDLGWTIYESAAAAICLISHGHCDHACSLPSHHHIRWLRASPNARYYVPEAVADVARAAVVDFRKMFEFGDTKGAEEKAKIEAAMAAKQGVVLGDEVEMDVNDVQELERNQNQQQQQQQEDGDASSSSSSVKTATSDRVQRRALRAKIVPPPDVQPALVGERIALKDKLFARPFATLHRVPSVGYVVYAETKRLKDEFRGLPADDVRAAKMRGEAIETIETHPVVAYSGDTMLAPVLACNDAMNADVLILECSFVADSEIDLTPQSMHVHLNEIVAHQDQFHNANIVLMHFSARYSPVQIVERLRSCGLSDSFLARTSLLYRDEFFQLQQ